MQNTTNDWQETNRSLFTRKAQVVVTITRADGKTPFIGGTDLISFTHIKNGDPLSGILAQDKITFTAKNTNGRLDYDAENDNDVYENAFVTVAEGFMKPSYQSYDGISGGIYFVTDVKRNSRGDRYTFTAQSILAFMTEKCKEDVFLSDNAYEMALSVIEQAEASKGVPMSDISLTCDADLLRSVTMEMIEGTDDLSLAETLQLIAVSCGCLLYVDRSCGIHIEKRGEVTEYYVLANKFLYSPLEIEFAEKIGNVLIVSNHGNTRTGTSYEGDKIGGTKTATIPIMKDSSAAMSLSFFMYNELTKGRRRFKAKCRFDPALDLFDIITIPNGKEVSAAIITGISATFNGAWKADIQACVAPGAELDLRICEIELLTVEQFESLRIEQLEPNLITDSLGDYLASSDEENALWEEI